jgi:LmbE family N-acetylglucosaminyl deacetylase
VRKNDHEMAENPAETMVEPRTECACNDSGEFEPSFPALIIAAHPDDETMAMGGCIARWRRLGRRVFILFLTDGVPNNPAYFAGGMQWTAEEYRDRRRAEALAAAQRLGVEGGDLCFAGLTDQRVAFDLAKGLEAIVTTIQRRGARSVFVCAYEGGHPDHDAANFLTTIALQQMNSDRTIEAWEFPLYTAAGDRLMYASFGHEGAEIEIELEALDLAQKKDAIGAYASQQETLKWFPEPRVEQFRRLKGHDYRRPPTNGRTVYEIWGWPMRAADVNAAFDEFMEGERCRCGY